MIDMNLPLNQVIIGDSGDVMAEWLGNSVDCIVTDPPYRIGFMGSSWDRALPPRRVFRQIFRVLKPGALAFIMSSPRQDVLWRMLSMLEGLGFELRQSALFWIFKTGFPKAYDVSKGIDRKLGLKREVLGYSKWHSEGRKAKASRFDTTQIGEGDGKIETTPASDLAKQWEGWKSQTGLKPALECILMVNKPLSESTIVDNVLKWGTGAINIDACRIPFKNEADLKGRKRGVLKSPPLGRSGIYGHMEEVDTDKYISPKGRFPAHLIISDGALDTGETTKSRASEINTEESSTNLYGWSKGGIWKSGIHYGDEGSPYRFFDLDAWAIHHGFLDVAKPSKTERDFGLWDFDEKLVPHGNYIGRDLNNPKNRLGGLQSGKAHNIHPTVKPIKLMAYLIELGCPPNGIVVDPFLGSGTTCISAKRLRRKWIGIEINPEYAEIARSRIEIKGPLDQFIDEK